MTGSDTNTIEWIEDDSPVEEREPGSGAHGSQRMLYGFLGVVAVAVVALGIVAVASYERVDSPLAATQPAAAPADSPDRFQTALATLPELTLIMPQFAGGPVIRIDSGSDVMVDDEAYPELHSFAVDASGTWLAALSGSATTGDAELWVGPVAGGLDVTATNVRGFAWHDSTPRTLAFGAIDESATAAAFTVDVASEFEPEPLFATNHHVEHWGDWGFVVRPSLTDQGFHVLSPTGDEIATGYRGSVAGALDGGLIVNAAGGRQSPLLIFPDNGRAFPIFTLTDTKVARSVADGGANGAVAVQVANFDTDAHEIRVFNTSGRSPIKLPTTEATGAMTFSADGSTLLYLSQDANGVTDLVQFDLATGSIISTPIDSSTTINHATSTIAAG